MDKLIYWIWLSLACTPASPTFADLNTKFKDAEDIYRADEFELRGVINPKISDRRALLQKDLKKAEEIYSYCKEKKIGIITYADEKYPNLLRTIPNPPVLLYYRGIWQNFNSGNFFASIVGTRSISDYGRKNTFIIARDLARAGAVIVSGMATGIDGVAHAGALSAGAPTVAVIGSGIDICYPPQHITLAREIVKNGCVITEYAPGTPPYKSNFPKRNRLISGLSNVTLVMEGKEISGSLITARCAFSQGRDVFAFPGNVGNPNSEVTNLLLKNGAKAFVSADDIVNTYEKKFQGRLNPFKLAEKSDFDMRLTLSELKISAVAPSDSIFNHKVPKRVKNRQVMNKNIEEEAKKAPDIIPDFDKDTLKIYKKIPVSNDIQIEELVDEENDLRTVMKILLKLEMNSFIVMLPGERVKRNLK